MKHLRHQIAAYLLVFTPLTPAAFTATVSVLFETHRFSEGFPPEGVELFVYDSSGIQVSAQSILGHSYSQDRFFGIDTDLPPGRYSFSFAFGGYSTDLFTVAPGTGFSGNIGSAQIDAFRHEIAHRPVDVPTVFNNSVFIDGSIDMQGRLFNMGISPYSDERPAFSLQIAEGGQALVWSSIVGAAPGSYMEAMRLAYGENHGLFVFGSPVLTQENAGNLFFPVKLAIGSGVSATGVNSFASGNGVVAFGTHSSAFGFGTRAQGKNQFVIGQYNIASQGNGTSDPVLDDPLFIVGNGANALNTSNAFVVKRSGDTEISGDLSVAGKTRIGTGITTTAASHVVVGKYNDTSTDSEGRNRAAGLFIVGMGTGDGVAQRKNALRVREDGTLLVQPAGDILMGGFQSGERP